MTNYFNKEEIKEQISVEQIFNLLKEWGGNPTLHNGFIISDTICHNRPGEGSHKLYFYFNSNLFRCYTGGCDKEIFDILELIIKVMYIQQHQEFTLYDAMKWIVNKFNLFVTNQQFEQKETIEDWDILENYERIQDIQVRLPNIILKEYDDEILKRFNYDVKLSPWLKEGISQDILSLAEIGYYPGDDQITIPHFDKDGRFIGLRGRCLCEQDSEIYGKYRPIRANGVIYSHPLSFNLYNFNNSRRNIPRFKKAIIVEGEKSSLKYRTYFGVENDISVACCGSNISAYQMQLLLDAGAQEVIIAFDRQFENVGDNEYNKLMQNFKKIRNKYSNFVQLSFIIDKKKLTGYKDSPLDKNKDIFIKLFQDRKT